MVAIGKMKAAKLDELDLQLLSMLRRDSSTPSVKLAASLGVTEGTIRNRTRRLRRAGVIRRFTVSVDPVMAGQGIVAFVLVNAVPGRLAEVARRLALTDAILEVHETHTYGDLLLKVRAASAGELAEVVSGRVKAVAGVAGTQVITVLNVWKDSP